MTRVRILALLPLLWSCGAAASDQYVCLGMWSQHFYKCTGCNEANELIGLQYGRTFVSTFKNSSGEETLFAGYDMRWRRKRVDLGVMLGGAIGYSMPITPGVIPYASVKINDKFRIKPAFFGVGISVLTEFKF